MNFKVRIFLSCHYLTSFFSLLEVGEKPAVLPSFLSSKEDVGNTQLDFP